MTETPQSVARKQAHYLQIMNKARQADYPVLVKMVLRKLAGLGMVGAVTTAGGCTVIPFPSAQAPAASGRPEQPLWWVILKLTLAIPGSVAALFLLSVYSFQSTWLP